MEPQLAHHPFASSPYVVGKNEPTPVDPAEYQATANELAAYSDVVGAADPVVVKARGALLTSLSTNISTERAHAALAKINDEIHAFTSSVTAALQMIPNERSPRHKARRYAGRDPRLLSVNTQYGWPSAAISDTT